MSEGQIAGVTVPYLDAAFIGGEWCAATGEPYRVRSPTTGQELAQVTLPSERDAAAAVHAAHEAGRRAWSTMPAVGRVEVCARFCAELEQRLEPMGRVWAAEAGMPVRYSTTLHRFGALGAWSTALQVAEDALRDDVRDSPLGQVLVRREPAGVVLAIMAYNGPLVTLATKVIPALLAGCPVVVKAAVQSQLIMRIVGVCAAAAGFPHGVLSILCADLAVARSLTADARVDLVSLTGGRTAAQEIIEATRERLARTHLELGGKSPALILDDAPIPQVLKSLVPGATGGAGQVCALLSRILVSQSRHDELIDAVRTAWAGLRVGDPLDPESRVGPLIDGGALARTEGFVRRAVAVGGTVVAGGGRPAGLEEGFFHEPTVVTGLGPGADLVRNEVFGPVTVVQTFTDTDDAVRLANDIDLGLAATVYTTDRQAALNVAGRLCAGSVAVNTFGPSVTAPFGGRKRSGWGRESGPEGIHEFTELKQIVLGPGV